jgi:hypothetical protein
MSKWTTKRESLKLIPHSTLVEASQAFKEDNFAVVKAEPQIMVEPLWSTKPGQDGSREGNSTKRKVEDESAPKESKQARIEGNGWKNILLQLLKCEDAGI